MTTDETPTDRAPHADDVRTLSHILTIGNVSGDWKDCLDLAYHMGRIRGAAEGAEQAIGFIGSKQ